MGAALDVDDDSSTVTIRLAGDFDAASAGAVREAVVEAEAAGRDVVLDLSCVEFIDSSGLGVIAAAAGRAEREGRRLTLSGPTAAVTRTLHMFGLDRLVTAS